MKATAALLACIGVCAAIIAALLIPSGGGPAMPGTTAPAGLPASAANQPVVTALLPSVARVVPRASVPVLPPRVDIPQNAEHSSTNRGSIAEPIIGGRATWYPASGMIAAAGPALRHYLGKHWRGTLVSVCSGRCVVVRLADWCACPRTLLDLSDDAFAQLAPLSRGVIRVSITRAVRVPEPPATDTE